MPDITVIIGVLYPIQYLFYSIELVWAQHHQALITLMQYDVFPDNLAERTFFQEKHSKLIQFIERQICSIRPVECKLISAIGIVGKIASIYAIGDNKQLNISAGTRDHPRLCGEKPEFPQPSYGVSGSPPPMRGKESSFL